MASPVVQSVTNTELAVIIVFDQNLIVTDDPGAGFDLTVNGQSHLISDSSHQADTIILVVDPIFADDTVVVSFENSPSYVFDAATGNDAASDFSQSSTNGSLIRRDVEGANSALFVPAPSFSAGDLTGKVEVELGRSDRDLVSRFGPIPIQTTYVHENDIAVSSPTSSVKNGTVVAAAITVPDGDEAESLEAMIEWQRRVRDNIITSMIARREMAAALPAAPGELFEL